MRRVISTGDAQYVTAHSKFEMAEGFLRIFKVSWTMRRFKSHSSSRKLLSVDLAASDRIAFESKT